MRATLVTLAGLALAVAGGGCGSGQGQARSGARRSSALKGQPDRSRASVATVPLIYRPLFRLPAPLRDPAGAGVGATRFVLLGGLDAADSSSAGIEVADLHGERSTAVLPGAQHDAQGASLDGQVYVFGGGSTSELSHILAFDPVHNTVRPAGSLPQAQSDVAVTALDGTAYVVGGYDGTNWLNTVLAWRPGTPVRVVARLPVGLRYSAVTGFHGRLLVLGGSTPSGASDAIYSVDPASGQVRQIGRLPHPITHAGAATLGSSVYLVGGRGDQLDDQSAVVWAVDPRIGKVRRAGRLPRALSDAAVLAVGDAIVVAGGLSPTGTRAEVGELVPAGR